MLFWIFNWRHQIRIRKFVQLNSNNSSVQTPVQLFSCELRKMFKNRLFTEHLRTTAFGFFIRLTVFATQWANRNQAFSIFEHVSSGLSISFIKKRLQHRCFPVNTAKFLRTSIFQNICEPLFLKSHWTKNETAESSCSRKKVFLIVY